MPTILRQDGFAVMIYTHDHLPQHVHLFKAEGEVIINLLDVSVRAIYDMKAANVRRALEVVAEHREFLLAEWERIHPAP